MEFAEPEKETILVDESGQLYLHDKKSDNLFMLSPRDCVGKLENFKGKTTELGKYALCY